MTEIKNELLIRHVKNRWIKEDKTIDAEAYRPRKKEVSERYPKGYEKNVSTQLKSCYPTIQNLENLKNQFDRTVLYSINADHANNRGYQCIQDGKCHVGITGDMEVLHNDFDTLEILASNSERLHPLP